MRGRTLHLLSALALTLLGFVLGSALFARSETYASSLASPTLVQSAPAMIDQTTSAATNCQTWDNSCHYCSWNFGSPLCPLGFGGGAVVSAVIAQPAAAYIAPSPVGQSDRRSGCREWDNTCLYCSWHVDPAHCP